MPTARTTRLLGWTGPPSGRTGRCWSSPPRWPSSAASTRCFAVVATSSGSRSAATAESTTSPGSPPTVRRCPTRTGSPASPSRSACSLTARASRTGTPAASGWWTSPFCCCSTRTSGACRSRCRPAGPRRARAQGRQRDRRGGAIPVGVAPVVLAVPAPRPSTAPHRPPVGHLPAPGRPVPVSTYRVQLHAGFGFDDAAAIVPYLADLGITHLYCSPCLQAAPGSTHGYDVVDHRRLGVELGGEPAHARLVDDVVAVGLGIVLDIVPNHMAVPVPESLNPAWWDVLRRGPHSPYAGWFDIYPHSPSPLLVPVLGDQLGACLDRGEVRYDDSGGEPVIRYYDHALPVAPGTEALANSPGGDLLALLDAQHYRLCHWRVAAEELNYRRLFDVTTLAGVRVERPQVFAATHELVLAQLRAGVLVDPAGESALTAVYNELAGGPTDYAAVVEASKRLVVTEVLGAEVNRLTEVAVRICRLDPRHRDHTRRTGRGDRARADRA